MEGLFVAKKSRRFAKYPAMVDNFATGAILDVMPY